MVSATVHSETRWWRLQLPRWLWVTSSIWALLVIAPWIAVTSQLHQGRTVDLSVAVGILIANAACTLAVGGAASLDRRPWRRVFSLSLIGLVAFAIAFFVVADAPASTADDHGAGLAVIVLALPLWVVAGVLLTVGMGLGQAIRGGVHILTHRR